MKLKHTRYNKSRYSLKNIDIKFFNQEIQYIIEDRQKVGIFKKLRIRYISKVGDSIIFKFDNRYHTCHTVMFSTNTIFMMGQKLLTNEPSMSFNRVYRNVCYLILKSIDEYSSY